MAYDRFDRERRWREGRPDFSDESMNRERDITRDRNRDDRGFFDRMGDEFRSWFGDEDRDHRDDRYTRGREWSGSERDYNPQYERELDRGRMGRDDREFEGDRNFRSGPWERDPYRRTSFAGSRETSAHDDRHYADWRRRQVDDLDRDYDDYRRERQTHFENDFGSWREKRMSKRQMLSGLREHMEVVGSDDKHVGIVDRVAGDRVILTRSDPDAGGVHHSLSCSDLDRIEGDKVFLDCSADKARERWRDESRSRALFEREDQGESGPHMLDRSFSGTYR